MSEEEKKELADKVRIENASVVAEAVVSLAKETATNLVKTTSIQTTESLVKALREVFGEHEQAQRFVDVTRIPLICKSIVEMHEDMALIKVSLNLIQKLVFGAVSIILIGVIGAVLALIIK